MAKSKNGPTDPLLGEVTAIKQLLIIALLRDGVKQRHIASALGVSESAISRAFPKGLTKTVKNGRDKPK